MVKALVVVEAAMPCVHLIKHYLSTSIVEMILRPRDQTRYDMMHRGTNEPSLAAQPQSFKGMVISILGSNTTTLCVDVC